MDSQICHVSTENFFKEVVNEKKPVLLMCMPVDYDFSHQLDLLEQISVQHGHCLKVGFLEESYIDRFKGMYNIKGTPTFILLREGREQDRSLGLADEQMLLELISPFVHFKASSAIHS